MTDTGTGGRPAAAGSATADHATARSGSAGNASAEIGARVVMSERIGPVTDIERRIAAVTGAELVLARLWTEQELVGNGRAADVLIVGASEPVNATVLGRLPRLRCVVRRGVGVDNVDIAAASRHGIGVAFIPDASVEEVSDHALSLLLSVERGVFGARAATAAQDLAAAGDAVGRARRFADLTLGIIGLGRIGRALSRKSASVFGTVIGCDPVLAASGASDPGVPLVELDELLRRSDLISLHAPADPGAPPLLGVDALARVRHGAVIVNTARGSLIDEEALLAAIERGQVAGAALDVTASEPVPLSSPLRAEPRITLTGHTAAKGVRSSASLREGAADAAIRVLIGDLPAYLADPEVPRSPVGRIPWTRGDAR
jgi:D-3-phosphoglycerate dehydrogenase